MNDLAGINFRGYPVTVVSDTVGQLLDQAATGLATFYTHAEAAHMLILEALGNAKDTAGPGEPSGWIFESILCGETVWIERFGGIRDLSSDRHDGGQWSIYLPEER